MRLFDIGHKDIFSLCPAYLEAYLTNIDPKTNTVVLIPISAMVMVITVLMIIAALIAIPIPITIVSDGLGDSTQENGSNEKGYYP